jgi:hypothetical protein
MLPTVTPNLYQLSGQHLHVTYTTTSLAGPPTLTYQDAHQGKSFKGDEIRAVACDLGTLISVTLHITPDAGSTSFSLFVPHMRIPQGTSSPMHTDGITTVHRTSFAPQLLQGQLDTYTITALQGTAQAVDF